MKASKEDINELLSFFKETVLPGPLEISPNGNMARIKIDGVLVAIVSKQITMDGHWHEVSIQEHYKEYESSISELIVYAAKESRSARKKSLEDLMRKIR